MTRRDGPKGWLWAGVDVADTHIAAELREHAYALRHNVGTPDKLHHNVGASAIGKHPDLVDAGPLVCVLGDVDRDVCAEPPCQREPVAHRVEHHHEPRPEGFRDRRRIEAEPAGDLDHHGLVERKVRPLEPDDDLRQGAIRAGDDLDGKPERHLVDSRAQYHVKMLRIAPTKYGHSVALPLIAMSIWSQVARRSRWQERRLPQPVK